MFGLQRGQFGLGAGKGALDSIAFADQCGPLGLNGGDGGETFFGLLLEPDDGLRCLLLGRREFGFAA